MRHEELPPLSLVVATFERLYARLGLDFTPAAREAIAFIVRARRKTPGRAGDAAMRPTLDSAASLGRWRDDLAAEEVETLRERTRGRLAALLLGPRRLVAEVKKGRHGGGPSAIMPVVLRRDRESWSRPG